MRDTLFCSRSAGRSAVRLRRAAWRSVDFGRYRCAGKTCTGSGKEVPAFGCAEKGGADSRRRRMVRGVCQRKTRRRRGVDSDDVSAESEDFICREGCDGVSETRRERCRGAARQRMVQLLHESRMGVSRFAVGCRADDSRRICRGRQGRLFDRRFVARV